MEIKYAVEFKNISKQFGDCIANRDISFQVEAGSIHGIIGENGAGKSTAMKILFGLYQPTTGSMKVFGQERSFASAIDAMKVGIGMVHQHFMLAEPFTALDNILLHENSGGAFSRLKRNQHQSELEALAKKYNFQINWKLPVEKLSVGEQQRIEILKVLSQDSKILILDEPTAVLTPSEVKELFANLRRLKEEGRTILIITHKLKEVMEITDNVTVFRAGKVVAERKTWRTHLDELAELMVGQSISLGHRFENNQNHSNSKVLEVKNLSLKDRLTPLQNLNFEIKSGEVLGIAGVEGNGQDVLIRALLNPRSSEIAEGSIRIHGQSTVQLSAGKIRQLGVGAFPEDRLRVGVLASRPVYENFLLGHHQDPNFKNSFFVNEKALRHELQTAIDKFSVKPNDQNIAFEKLSGGNQQKLVAARELWHAPKFLIAAQPTRGVDIGAVEFIHSQIIEARNKGAGVLLISSELDEVLRLSDRVMVLFKGQLIAEFKTYPFPESSIGAAMGGKEFKSSANENTTTEAR